MYVRRSPGTQQMSDKQKQLLEEVQIGQGLQPLKGERSPGYRAVGRKCVSASRKWEPKAPGEVPPQPNPRQGYREPPSNLSTPSFLGERKNRRRILLFLKPTSFDLKLAREEREMAARLRRLAPDISILAHKERLLAHAAVLEAEAAMGRNADLS
jgi:hypothetical protein